MPFYRPLSGQSLGQLRQEFDRVFTDLARAVPMPSSFSAARPFPAVNVWETPHDLYAEAELPGVRESDLEILVVGNELTLKGKRPEPSATDAAYHRRERPTGGFTRVVKLPTEVNPDAVEASLRSGVLEIKLPKAEQAKPRKIQVTTAG